MMTLHRLHAGDGYTYLTRQVTSGDVTRKRGESMADYYVVDGNPPGRWVGEGLAGLGVEGYVSEPQMLALYGEGRHPDADTIQRQIIASGGSGQEAVDATQLGRRFPKYERPADDGFDTALEAAHAVFRAENDRDAQPGAEQSGLRQTAARQVLVDAGKAAEPADVARFLANRKTGADRQPVAGFDLVFTPVKSVSTLWGLGDDSTRQQVSEAHEAAWRGTLAWLESNAAYTRVGAGGVAQVDTLGLVATAFDHIDSRAGDPNLHTHLVIANKVQGLDGKWRSLDGRVLYNLKVTASETYTMLLENELTRRLGVRFVERNMGADKRPVRELAGMSPELTKAFSRRRQSIDEVFADLVADYRAAHGHEPSKPIQYRLAQRATLATRPEKEEGVRLSTRRDQWRARAAQVLGSDLAVDDQLARVLDPAQAAQVVRDHLSAQVDATGVRVDLEDAMRPKTFDELTAQVFTNLHESRSTWTIAHVRSEAIRVARTQGGLVDPDRIAPLAEALTGAVIDTSVRLTPADPNPVPALLQRVGGASVYRLADTDRYTSLDILNAEEDVVAAAATPGGLAVSRALADSTIDRLALGGGVRLDGPQAALVRHFACSGTLLAAGIGPAGTGKTTAMAAFADVVSTAGGRVVGLAPSAKAAAGLAEELGVQTDTLAKFLHVHTTGVATPADLARLAVDERTVILVDEAGMSSTPDVAAVVDIARKAGASVRLLGDPAQLQAVGAGGLLRLVDHQVGAVYLEEIHRFADPNEKVASLALRDGDTSGLEFYIDHARTAGGTRGAMTDELYAAWTADQADGKTSLMIAASRLDVRDLSARARVDRIAAGLVEADGVALHDETRAGRGDLVVTRHNDRRLQVERGSDFVKNGDVWQVLKRHKDGALTCRHTGHHNRVTLPASYVAEHVELAYATTIHRAQGMTVDTAHALVDPTGDRAGLYTSATRGRQSNRLYVVVDELVDTAKDVPPDKAASVRQVLADVLARAGEDSAIGTLVSEHEAAMSLLTLVPAYEDAWARFGDVGHHGIDQVLRDALPAWADQVLDDPAWPSLRSHLRGRAAGGADLVDLLRSVADPRELASADSLAQVLLWRIEQTDPIGATDDVEAPAGSRLPAWVTAPPAAPVDEPTGDVGPSVLDPEAARVVAVNEAAWQLWTANTAAEDAWVPGYLEGRGLGALAAGQAPAGWTATIDQLRAQGFSDEDLVAAGVATTSSRGTLIDRFRDRLVLPIRDDADRVVAFTARANPATAREDTPKYLNSNSTAAYDKSMTLYGLDAAAIARLRAGAQPLLVEGAMDHAAIAQTAAAHGLDVVPVATCGTSVTVGQLDLLRSIVPGGLARLVVGLDSDTAGRKAAARVWGLLEPEEAATAGALLMPDGVKDPGVMVEAGRGEELADRIADPQNLTSVVVDHALDAADTEWVETRVAAARSIAAAVAPLPAPAIASVVAQVAHRLDLAASDDVLLDIFMTAHLDAAFTKAPTGAAPSGEPEPRQPVMDESVATWLRGQADLIAARLDGLVDQVQYAPPAWATVLRPCPSDPPKAAAWRADVRTVVAYRDRWAVTTPSAPVPAAPAAGLQERVRQQAAAAAARLVAPDAPAPAGASGAYRRQLREQTAQRLAALHNTDPNLNQRAADLKARAEALAARRGQGPQPAAEETAAEKARRILGEQRRRTEHQHDPNQPREEGPQL